MSNHNERVNKVILVGNLGKDPEVKYTASGIAVARFSLATSERFKDQSGQFQERTEWHTVVAWQKLAEIIGEFMRKSSKVYVEGKLQSSLRQLSCRFCRVNSLGRNAAPVSWLSLRVDRVMRELLDAGLKTTLGCRRSSKSQPQG
jgi:hypothetical protein